jgi:hypothetical protein
MLKTFVTRVIIYKDMESTYGYLMICYHIQVLPYGYKGTRTVTLFVHIALKPTRPEVVLKIMSN